MLAGGADLVQGSNRMSVRQAAAQLGHYNKEPLLDFTVARNRTVPKHFFHDSLAERMPQPYGDRSGAARWIKYVN